MTLDRAVAQNASSSRKWTILAAFGLLALFVAVVLFFRVADVYHKSFFQISPSLALAYNLARLILGGIIFWSCLGLGGLASEALGLHVESAKTGEQGGGTPRVSTISGLDRLILDFFIGGTLLGCFWYALGLLGLLHWPVAIGVHAIALLGTAARLGRLLRRLKACLGSALGSQLSLALGSAPHAVAGGLLLGLLTALAGACMLANFALNALVPGGTHDVFVHYFPYLAQVLTSGTTFPGAGSDAWYHFYYTKSQGLFFLAGLLSDPLAPQVVSGVYIAVAGLCVYSLLRIPLLPRHLAMTGLIAFHLAFLSDADFVFHQKGHIVMLGNLAGMLWICIRLWQKAPGFVSVKGSCWGMCVVCAGLGAGCILNAPAAMSVALPFSGGLAALALLMHSRRGAAPGLAAVSIGLGCGLALTFLVNYSLTGMAEITPFRLFWGHADLARFSRWVSPYLMVLVDQGSGEMGKLSTLRLKLLFKAKYYFDVFKPAQLGGLFVLPVLAAGALVGALGVRPADAALSAALKRLGETALPCLLFGAVILAVGIGTRQDVSYARFTGFALLPVVILTMLLWQMLLCAPTQHHRWGGTLAGSFALVLAVNCLATVPLRLPQEDRAAALAFITGQLSIAQQYTRLSALWPPATEIRETIPAGARVRLLHISPPSESMAPYAPLETDISFSLRGGWHVVMFDPADQARACLKAQQLNFFLFDTTLPLFDFIIHSPLFAQESLSRNFKVLWRKGDVFLLTWADSAQAETLSHDMEELLERWSDCMIRSEASTPTKALYDRVRLIYEMNNKSTTDIRIPADLPPVRGWQS